MTEPAAPPIETPALPADLATFVEQTLAEARRQLANHGQVEALIAVRLPDGRISPWQIPGPLNEIFNSPAGKDVLFGTLRRVVAELEATAVILATDMWFGEPTEKQRTLSREALDELRRAPASLDDYVRRGLAMRRQALVVTVQTARDVFILCQLYDRSRAGVTFTERRLEHVEQENFAGRQKMYGVH